MGRGRGVVSESVRPVIVQDEQCFLLLLATSEN